MEESMKIIQEYDPEISVKTKFKNWEFLLKKDFGEEVTVIKYRVDDLVPLGDNFASDILKINAKLKRTENSPVEDYNFVAKLIAPGKSDIDWTWLFTKEIFMYTEILPFYLRVEQENNIKEKKSIINLIPKFYGYRFSLDPNVKEVDENSMMLLENIRERGYYVVNKNVGLDLKHATEATKTLAKFHAMGIASKKHHSDKFMKNLPFATKPGMPYKGGEIIQDNIISLMKDHIHLSKFSDVVQKIADRRSQNRMYQMVTDETWSTICHNDFWTNNIMFHEDENGNINDVKIIDFQTYCFANVTVDLPYFLCGSLDYDTKINHFDDLLDVYHQAFLLELKNLNVSTQDYSKDKFDEQLKKDAPFDFMHCAMALLFFTIETDQAKSRDEIIYNIFNSKGNDFFFKKLNELIDIYVRKKWLH